MTNNVTENPKVLMQTSLGAITIELYPDKTPATVENFLKYVDSGFYSGTVFHRVIPNFMIQCGGMTASLDRKETLEPIKNEADNGLSNSRGTLAMARTGVVDSATSQFFINVVDNKFLDFKNKSTQGYGYCVFGKVVDGMDVADKIAAVETGTINGYQDAPKTAIIITSMELLNKPISENIAVSANAE